MYNIEQKKLDTNLVGNKPEIIRLDATILHRLVILSFELQSILYNYNKSCTSTETKKAVYLETYVNYIGEIFNQSIISNQSCQQKNLKEPTIYNK